MIIPPTSLFAGGAPTGAVTISVSGAARAVDTKASLTLLNIGASVLTQWFIPITSPEVDYTQLSDSWVEVARPGRSPFLVRQGGRLSKVKLTATFVSQASAGKGAGDVGQSVEQDLETFINMARSRRDQNGVLAFPAPVALTYGPIDSSKWLTDTGHWQITDLSIHSVQREPITNAITQATMTIELTENSDPPGTPMLDSRGAFPQPGSAPPIPKSPGSVVTVQHGDTLYSIAIRVYGAPEPGWRTLAAANGIKDPRSISVGQALLIP
jgi:LysM repeat protein